MTPVRLLVVEIDPDDTATRTLARALRDEGAEVVYASATTADEIAATAVQEDVRAVGFAVRTDAHRALAAEVAGRNGMVVFATVEHADAGLGQAGTAAVFVAESAEHVLTWAGKLA
jgi:methylmalonyl-CoA mutase cobalamin-binding domain/chain